MAGMALPIHRETLIGKVALRVVVARPSWLELPVSVRARMPTNRNQPCEFSLPMVDAEKAALAARRQLLMELWSVVLGQPPPVPNVSTWGPNKPADKGLSCLEDAHACFQGINRPLAEDDSGEKVLVYIIKPRFFYVFTPHMVCVARKADVPPDLVFAVYVRAENPDALEADKIGGMITHWHFVEASGDSRFLLPVNHTARYRVQRW